MKWRTSKGFGGVAVLLACSVITLLALVRASHFATQATALRQQTREQLVRAQRLVADTRQSLAKNPPMIPVPEEVALTLSTLERSAAYHGVDIERTSVHGATQESGNGLENLDAASKPSARYVGLRKVEVVMTGSWNTLPGLAAYLKQLHDRPTRVVGIDIGPRYLRMTLAIFGR